MPFVRSHSRNKNANFKRNPRFHGRHFINRPTGLIKRIGSNDSVTLLTNLLLKRTEVLFLSSPFNFVFSSMLNAAATLNHRKRDEGKLHLL